MKKITSIIIALSLALSLAACCAVDETLPTEPTEEVTELVTEEVTETEEVLEEDENVESSPEVKPEEEKKPENSEENKEEAEGEKTLGNTLLAFFKEQAAEGKNITEIAEAITTHPSIVFNCMAVEMEKGYLPGFNEEITSFDKAVSFAPMIGSIAFVGYVFETEDADALIETLKANANLRWNICVEAEEMVVGKSGNKVFFVMCPKNMEE